MCGRVIDSAWVVVLLSVGSSAATCAFFLGRLVGRVDRADEASAKLANRMDKVEKDYVTSLVCDAHKQHICQLVGEIKAITTNLDNKIDGMILLNGRVTEFMDADKRRRDKD